MEVPINPTSPSTPSTDDVNGDEGTDSSIARGYQWVSRILTVSLEMAVPGALGAWADTVWHTSPLGVILGVALGMTMGMMHLLHMVRTS